MSDAKKAPDPRWLEAEEARDFGFETEILEGIDVGETVAVNPKDEMPEGTQVQPVALPTK